MAALYSVNQYVKNMKSLKSFLNKIKVSDDVEIVKERLLDSLGILNHYLLDLKFSTEKPQICDKHINLLTTVTNTIKAAADINGITMVSAIVDLLNEKEIEDIKSYHMNRDADNNFYGYNEGIELPASHVRGLYNLIKNTNPLNIFHIECQYGSNVKNFCKEGDKSYGQLTGNSKRAHEHLIRTIHGPLKGSHITNNFFDVLFLVPKIGYEERKDFMGTIIEPEERLQIKNTIKYVRPGGVVCITIPYTRMMPSLAMYLSKVLSNVTVSYVPTDGLRRITIMGTKNADFKVSNKEIYQQLKLFNYNDAVDVLHYNPCYEIPTEELTLEFFRGSKLDLDDVIAASQDNMIDNFLESQTDPLVVKDQSPLLPFNIGQVGLVLTSGCLDGVVEEVDGVYHVIKGMTTKVTTTTEEDVDQNTIKSTETISNRVKINIFTADGKFIELG